MMSKKHPFAPAKHSALITLHSSLRKAHPTNITAHVEGVSETK